MTQANPVYTGRVVFGRTKQERVQGTENEYRRVKSDECIVSDDVVHEPLVSNEIFECAQAKMKGAAGTGNLSVGRMSKHLLSGILKYPMCGSFMYADASVWTNKDGTRRYKRKYQCGHYAKAKFG